MKKTIFYKHELNHPNAIKIIERLLKFSIVPKDRKIEFLIGSSALWGLNPCLVGTDKELVVFNNLSQGLPSKQLYPYESITACVMDQRILSKMYIVIGGSQNVTIDKIFAVAGQPLFDFLQSKISKSSPLPMNKIIEGSADEIKKYKELLDVGAITQDEYNDKKKQLLGI